MIKKFHLLFVILSSILFCKSPAMNNACDFNAEAYQELSVFRTLFGLTAGPCFSVFFSQGSAVPPNITGFGTSTAQLRLIPLATVRLLPVYTGEVSSWTLSASLPTGLTFNQITGDISGTVPSISGGMPSVNYTITASNSYGSSSYIFPLQILASGDIVWTKLIGVSGSNTSSTNNGIAYDSATKSVYLSGMSTGGGNLDGEVNSALSGWSSAFVSRYSADGVRAWTRLTGFGTATINIFAGQITVDNSGNVLWATFANTQSSGLSITVDGNLVNAASRIPLVTKYDKDGNRIWTRSRSSSVNGVLVGIGTDGSGNVFAAGGLYAPAMDGQTNTGWTDSGLVLMKHDSSGNWTSGNTAVIASSVSSSSQHVEAMAVGMDSLGNAYLVGYSRAASLCAAVSAQTSILLFKYINNMAYAGCQGSGVSGSDSNGYGIAIDSSDNIYLSGDTLGNLDAIAKTGTQDAVLIKYNSSMVKQFTRLYGVAAGTTISYSVAVDSSGNIYMTGSTTGNLNGQTKSGIQDAFVMKLDSLGNVLWTKLLGVGTKTSFGSGVVLDSDGAIYIAGYTDGNLNGETNVGTNQSLFLVKIVK
ncbi:SBBP repeat-containing protein [Leptospira ilyithenensis]|uniref:Beta-propeller repeat protein n=1 Tax=Leptospira ilyithenensis TaxID=2484901 RepID=A0A4R9LKP3_9LEPT|nr:SBBP repeat-containing protein [Leptospira ilyithenensis]TGN08155.1 hypothetical protein EHS11_14600 [Leptospira ilyithenensis]